MYVTNLFDDNISVISTATNTVVATVRVGISPYNIATGVAPPPQIEVTFRIDMSKETVHANGVHIAGNFQGWNPGTTMMTDMDGNDVYEVRVKVDPNGSLLYKFINGNDWPFQEPNDALVACGVDDSFGGYNRLAEVGTTDTTLLDVCFASCDTCDSSTSITDESGNAANWNVLS